MSAAVAIVIVNWNKKNDVLKLLASLETITYTDYHTILVDNASTDGSVETVTNQFPDIHIIRNRKNLGGTGGFNTGLRYALTKGDYKYIWLLDNDAEVEKDTLTALVKAMEDDPEIGIAGSRIIDIAKRDVTIEAGSFFRWDTIEVKPLFRNETNIDTTNTICTVDYVAICSALIRTSALKRVGLMDDRYFLFWDDMDWGLQFKKRGFKVVAVLNSVAYHPAFTEKRSALVDFYYGNRNPLLTYAKHAKPARKFTIYFRHFRYKFNVLFFLGLNGRRDLMKLGLRGMYDFIIGRWGGIDFGNIPPERNLPALLPVAVRSIIILNTGSRDTIYAALQDLKRQYPDASFSLLIEDDRAAFFQSGFDAVIPLVREKQASLLYLMNAFIRIAKRKYDMAIIPNYPSPFSYAVKSAYKRTSSGAFTEHEGNRRTLWKLLLALFLGETVSFLFLPLAYFRSLSYACQAPSITPETDASEGKNN